MEDTEVRTADLQCCLAGHHHLMFRHGPLPRRALQGPPHPPVGHHHCPDIHCEA